MKAGRFVYSVIGVLTLMSVTPSQAFAQHDHGSTLQYPTADQSKKEAALVKVVREATERYRDVRVAEREGFALNFGCVSGSEFGAMGLHYVNMARVGDGVLDPTRPDHRRRLSRARRSVEYAASRRAAAAHGTAVSLLRRAQPLRAAALLHLACVGVERQSDRLVRELAPERFVRRVQGPELMLEVACSRVDGSTRPLRKAGTTSMMGLHGLDRSGHGHRAAELGAASRTAASRFPHVVSSVCGRPARFSAGQLAGGDRQPRGGEARGRRSQARPPHSLLRRRLRRLHS